VKLVTRHSPRTAVVPGDDLDLTGLASRHIHGVTRVVHALMKASDLLTAIIEGGLYDLQYNQG